MKKIDKKIADAYFREKNTYMIIFFSIWFIVSYCVVAFADSLNDIQILWFPCHYFMGAVCALATLIVLLFSNAIVGDRIDRRYGIDEKRNEDIGSGSVSEH